MQRLIFKTKEEAEKVLLQIVQQIELNKKNIKNVNQYIEQDTKDYMQGFKDGCEYTLKLKTV